MNEFFLHFHSAWRWIVLILSVWAISNSISGISKKSAFTASNAKTARLFVMSMHIQFLLGIVMYFGFSTYFELLKSDPSLVMKTPIYRFFAVEHFAGMLVAVALATVGNALVKKAITDTSKHKKALIFFGLSLVIMLAMIPWPFMEKFAGNGWF